MHRIISNLNSDFDIKAVILDDSANDDIAVLDSSKSHELRDLIYSSLIPIIEYTAAAKAISEKLSILIYYSTYNFTKEELENISQIAELLSKEVIVTRQPFKKIKMELTTDKAAINSIIESHDEKLFRIEHPSVDNIFNTPVALPKINNYFIESDCYVSNKKEINGCYICDIEFNFTELGTIETRLS